MKNIKIKKNDGFSLIETIISISLLVLLGIIGYASKVGYDENSSNSKIISDTKTINNALIQYSQENSKLPMPGGNINFYGSDTSYMHSYEDFNTFGVYGSFTEDTLSKKYLDTTPLDPRTNFYYAYGKTKKSNQFEIASVQVIDSTPLTKLIGNYKGESGPTSLIREYNGPVFVYGGSEENLPYNPDELILVAEDIDGNRYRVGDTITVNAGEELELFFSDGSVSILGDNNNETKVTLNELSFAGKDNLNTIVKLGLQAGKIWTKATRLNKNSKFEITTSDSTAAVRGTIFYVDKNSEKTEVIVLIGEVDIIKNENVLKPEIIENIKVKIGEKPKKLEIKFQNNEFIKKIIESREIHNLNFDGKIIEKPIFTILGKINIEYEIEEKTSSQDSIDLESSIRNEQESNQNYDNENKQNNKQESNQNYDNEN